MINVKNPFSSEHSAGVDGEVSEPDHRCPRCQPINGEPSGRSACAQNVDDMSELRPSEVTMVRGMTLQFHVLGINLGMRMMALKPSNGPVLHLTHLKLEV